MFAGQSAHTVVHVSISDVSVVADEGHDGRVNARATDRCTSRPSRCTDQRRMLYTGSQHTVRFRASVDSAREGEDKASNRPVHAVLAERPLRPLVLVPAVHEMQTELPVPVVLVYVLIGQTGNFRRSGEMEMCRGRQNEGVRLFRGSVRDQRTRTRRAGRGRVVANGAGCVTVSRVKRKVRNPLPSQTRLRSHSFHGVAPAPFTAAKRARAGREAANAVAGGARVVASRASRAGRLTGERLVRRNGTLCVIVRDRGWCTQ